MDREVLFTKIFGTHGLYIFCAYGGDQAAHAFALTLRIPASTSLTPTWASSGFLYAGQIRKRYSRRSFADIGSAGRLVKMEIEVIKTCTAAAVGACVATCETN